MNIAIPEWLAIFLCVSGVLFWFVIFILGCSVVYKFKPKKPFPDRVVDALTGESKHGNN